MPHSDPPRRGFQAVDWRGWLALAWVIVFGLLYARTVIESRGVQIRSWVVGNTLDADS